MNFLISTVGLRPVGIFLVPRRLSFGKTTCCGAVTFTDGSLTLVVGVSYTQKEQHVRFLIKQYNIRSKNVWADNDRSSSFHEMHNSKEQFPFSLWYSLNLRHQQLQNTNPGADPGFCEEGFEGGFVDSLKGTFEQK